MTDPFARPKIRTGAFYQNPDQAMNWLHGAFGFDKLIEVRDRAGHLVHAEMQFGGCSIVIDGEWTGVVSSPLSLDGKTTQIIYVQIDSGLDAHFARARDYGATIISDPQDQYYGDRMYRAKDIEGHIWTFSQAIKRVGRVEAEQLGDVKISGWHDS